MSKRTHAEALETKKSILLAAQRVFSEKGFAKASLSDIAREANVTRGAIYWHFENKNELLAAIFEEEGHRLNLISTLNSSTHEEQRDPLGLLKQWAYLHFSDIAADFINSPIANIFHSVISSDVKVEAREKLLELMQTRRFRIEEALRAAVRVKQLPSDVDIELAASYIHATLGGLISCIRQGTGVQPVSRYKVVIDLLFAQIANIKRTEHSHY